MITGMLRSLGLLVGIGDYRRELDAQLAKCESPIEVLFVETAWPILTQYGRLVTQYPLAGYRLDVALPELRIAVEVDGRDYHAVDPEQVDRDKHRDRVAMSHGWLVIRFPGREIYAGADKCAAEVARIIVGRS